MATGTTYSDRVFLFRLETLVIDGGIEVLRTIFDQSLKNQPLNVFLANEKTNIMSLRAKKIITSAQFDLLYPKSGQPADSKTFDITLIVCLLRNLPNLGVNQNYKWNTPPQPLDQTIEANLHRLKSFRNDIAHIASTTGFTQSSFQKKWNEIEQVLLRLNSAVPKPLANFNQTIDSYKHSPIDPAAEQKLQTTIGQWREMEKGLEADFKQIKLDVSGAKRKIVHTDHRVQEVEKEVKKTKENASQEEIEKLAYDKMKTKLQDDLISFYKHQHQSIHLSPLMEEDQPLLKFYEMPDILLAKVTRSRDGNRLERTPVKTLHDMFYKENKLCSNIYLTAEAGYGKTAFSKKLALAWCHAMKPDTSEEKYFSKHEITDMSGFSFVFLVLLSDSSSECDIDMLIWNQVLSQLAHRFPLVNLKNILHNEKCLVILDGLDKWTHPVNSCRRRESNIPHQTVRENVAVLTTTRPWKLSVSGLHSSQIDQKLELQGLSDDSAKKLKRSVISHLHGELDESKIDEYETKFNMIVQENHKSDLTGIPLFLMYFLFLWFHKMYIGESLADLYSGFIELLLCRTVKKVIKIETVQGNIPPCFNTNTLCKHFYTLLTALGKLAFYTLCSETKENRLVFDGCIAEKYLSKDQLTFCLKTGIITQSKVQGASLLHQKTKVSFAHKTMQEFLAALYINSATDQKSIQEIMLSKCKCVRDILDISKMFMFIVSINGEFSFSSELMKIINEDEITQEYRKSLQGRGLVFSHPLKDLQDMYISCCKEIPPENEVNLCLQDVTIDYRCQQEEYRENLKRLTTRNKQNIRSVYIDMDDKKKTSYIEDTLYREGTLYMEDTPFDTGREVIDYFALSDLENIEKIHYSGTRGEDIDDIILPWLNSSVTSLYLSCGSWSRSLTDKVTSLQKLEAIGIRGFKMSHSELRLLLDFISRRDCLREIVLWGLDCTGHRRSCCTGHWWSSCTGHRLLWRHKSLRKLSLTWLELSQVIINMASLENCVLHDLYNRHLVLKFVNCADNKLNTFTCEGIRSSAAIDEIVRMLRESRHVRRVELESIDLGRRNLTLSPDFVNIKHLSLYKVSMEGSACRDLVGSVLELKQTVTVDIDRCTISPKEEFETLKGEIKTSQRTRILGDEDGWFGYRFGFETIKDADLFIYRNERKMVKFCDVSSM